MMPKQEDVGKRFFEIINQASQRFSFSDLYILRSAWKGKIAWEELPDHLRTTFFQTAVEITGYINTHNATPPGR